MTPNFKTLAELRAWLNTQNLLWQTVYGKGEQLK